MDPRIRIYPKISWIRNTEFFIPLGLDDVSLAYGTLQDASPGVSNKCVDQIVFFGVAGPHHFDTDAVPDPDLACHFDSDPDTSFHFDVDPDPTVASE
jgi:hypothetical protein